MNACKLPKNPFHFLFHCKYLSCRDISVSWLITLNYIYLFRNCLCFPDIFSTTSCTYVSRLNLRSCPVTYIMWHKLQPIMPQLASHDLIRQWVQSADEGREMRAILYGENIVSWGKMLKFNYHRQRKKVKCSSV